MAEEVEKKKDFSQARVKPKGETNTGPQLPPTRLSLPPQARLATGAQPQMRRGSRYSYLATLDKNLCGVLQVCIGLVERSERGNSQDPDM